MLVLIVVRGERSIGFFAQRAGVQLPRARYIRMRQNCNDLAREAVGLHARVGRQRIWAVSSSVLFVTNL